MLLRGLRGLVAGVAVLGMTAACSVLSDDAPATANGSGQLTIVTALYPFQYAAQAIAGDRAQVTSLTAPGAEPHDLELKPKQIADIGSASLVVYEKSFQASVDDAVGQSNNPNLLDVAAVIPLRPLAEDDHEGAETGDGHDHGESGLDPHVWLDPVNMIAIGDAVRDRLSTLDPEHAAQYRANAATFTDQLQELNTAYADGLKNCQLRDFITTHAAFGYLAARYDLEQIGISGLSPDAEPSPARIAEVQRLAREHQVTTIFSETLVSPAVAESIAGDLGLVTDVLDPIEGITPESRGQDYRAVMQANLSALQKANSCR